MIEDGRMYKITVLLGLQLLSIINTISDWRIKEFKEYPYLYEGNLEYEKDYSNAYVKTDKSSAAVAYDNDTVVGFLTGIPLIEDKETFPDTEREFVKYGFDPKTFYYFGEIIVDPQYRHKGIASKLFTILENKVSQELGYKNVCFITIEHPENHPLKPTDYQDSSVIWQHLGYEKKDIKVSIVYPTIQPDGSVQNKENVMVYWVKKLN